MSRARKPTALKILQGNPGKRKLPQHEPKPPEGQCLPPAGLSKAELSEWNQLAPVLETMRVLTTADQKALAVLCGLLTAWTSGADRDARLAGEIRQYLTQFGMTPSSRAKVSVPPEKPASRLEQFRGVIVGKRR